MAGFEKIMGISAQGGNPDRSRDNPHRVGAENLNILYECLVAALSENV